MEYECEQCGEIKEITPFYNPILGKIKYVICDQCNEDNYDKSLEGEY